MISTDVEIKIVCLNCRKDYGVFCKARKQPSDISKDKEG